MSLNRRVSRGMSAAMTFALICHPLASHADNGTQLDSYSAIAYGMGGASIGYARDLFAAVNNPATMGPLGTRFDFSTTVVIGDFHSNVYGSTYSDTPNAIAPNIAYNYKYEDWTFGITASGQGSAFNNHAPIPLFGKSELVDAFGTVNLLPTVTYSFAPGHYIGVSAKFGYQFFSFEGLENFGARSTYDWGYGAGFNIGYYGQITRDLTVGVSYMSPTWFSKMGEFSNILPNGGEANLPQQAGAGLSYKIAPDWTAAIDYLWINWSGSKLYGNPTDLTKALGASDGPGFGWQDQHIVRFGLNYQWDQYLELRAGASLSNNPVQSDYLFFTIIAPQYNPRSLHAGFTYKLREGWEMSGAVAHDLEQTINGTGNSQGIQVNGRLSSFVLSIGKTY